MLNPKTLKPGDKLVAIQQNFTSILTKGMITIFNKTSHINPDKYIDITDSHGNKIASSDLKRWEKFEYNKWYEWGGNDLPPCDPNDRVEYEMRKYPERTNTKIAKTLRWEHKNKHSDIIKYRVLQTMENPEKVPAPKGYKHTDVCRIPTKKDIYLSPSGDVLTPSNWVTGPNIQVFEGKRWILEPLTKEKLPSKPTDKQIKGYVVTEYRLPKKGEKYWWGSMAKKIDTASYNYDNNKYWILEKKSEKLLPKPLVSDNYIVTDEYRQLKKDELFYDPWARAVKSALSTWCHRKDWVIVEKPTIPQGYKYVGYRVPKHNEKYICNNIVCTALGADSEYIELEHIVKPIQENIKYPKDYFNKPFELLPPVLEKGNVMKNRVSSFVQWALLGVLYNIPMSIVSALFSYFVVKPAKRVANPVNVLTQTAGLLAIIGAVGFGGYYTWNNPQVVMDKAWKAIPSVNIEWKDSDQQEEQVSFEEEIVD